MQHLEKTLKTRVASILATRATGCPAAAPGFVAVAPVRLVLFYPDDPVFF
jgi:hypothetical protein